MYNFTSFNKNIAKLNSFHYNTTTRCCSDAITCLRSSTVEQRYRKPQVIGSNPIVGSY